MSITNPYLEVGQGDVASFEDANGVFYRCYVWYDSAAYSVVAQCFVEQPHGQDVVLWREVIVTGVYDGGTYPFHPISHPRIVAVNDATVGWCFVVGYAHTFDDEIVFYRRTLTTTSEWTQVTGSGWTPIPLAGSSSVGWIWDMCESFDRTKVVVTYRNAFGTHSWFRGNAGADVDWFAIDPTKSPVNCLTVFCTDDDVCMAFQSYDVEFSDYVWLTRSNYSDGTNIQSDEVFVHSTFGDAEWGQVSISEVQDNIVLVTAEGLHADEQGNTTDYIRFVAWRAMESDTAARYGLEQMCHNLNLITRTWSWPSADGTYNDVYAIVGFKSIRDVGNWSQHNYYAVNLDVYHSIPLVAGRDELDSLVTRPFQCGTINLGTADSRSSLIPTYGNSIGRIYNHLSHVSGAPSSGPDSHSITVAATIFARVVPRYSGGGSGGLDYSIELYPTSSRVVGYRWYPDEPWTPEFPREVSEPDPLYAAFAWGAQRSLESGYAMITPGGTTMSYDGVQAVESGFAWYPEIINYQGSGSSSESKQYLWVVTYEWRDAAGQLHRSAPSFPLQRTITTATPSATLTVRCQNLTCRESIHYLNAPRIDLVLWRSTANPSAENGITFRRVHGHIIEQTTPNEVTEPYVNLTDSVSDVILQFNELLPYTLQLDGNWLPVPPYQPPACTAAAVWQNRIWIASSEDPRVLWYSKEVLPEGGGTQHTAPEFSPTLSYRIDDGGGAITGMQAMDQQMVVFKQDRVYLLAGSPANDLGEGASLQHATISIGTGCIDARSIVHTPVGVIFQSAKGLYMLSRQTGVDYIGADVEDIVRGAGHIRAATLLEDRHQVRFVLNQTSWTGYSVLIFDYLQRMWSVGELPELDSEDPDYDPAADALQAGLSWRGRSSSTQHVMLSHRALHIETEGTYADGATPVLGEIRTGWIGLSGIQGLVKLREIVIQIAKPGLSRDVEVYVEYDVTGLPGSVGTTPDAVETFTWAGGTNNSIRLRPKVSKCTAFRVTIREPSAQAAAASPEIVSIGITYGRKTRFRRHADTQSGAGT